MDVNEFAEKFPHRVARWYGEVSYEIIRSNPDFAMQQIEMDIEANIKYDLDKILNEIVGNLVPVLYKDLPDYILAKFPEFSNLDFLYQVEYKGARLYIAKGAPKEWEKKLLYERLRRG